MQPANQIGRDLMGKIIVKAEAVVDRLGIPEDKFHAWLKAQRECKDAAGDRCGGTASDWSESVYDELRDSSMIQRKYDLAIGFVPLADRGTRTFAISRIK